MVLLVNLIYDRYFYDIFLQIQNNIEEIQEQLIIQELQLQRGMDFGIRISDGELNQTFIRN